MYKYFLLFIIYSGLGWIIEVLDFLIIDKKFVNRGFLIGPYCPIYGVGAIIMILTLSKYIDSPVVLFVMSIVIFSCLEYYTSYFMEKIFKARWWDYSERKFNINGRICLETMIPFGLLGLLTMYVINPYLNRIIDFFSEKTIFIITIILFIIFVIDLCVSFKIISSFAKYSISVKCDSTEKITKKVRKVLYKKSALMRRLIDAFPNFISAVKRITNRII